MDAARWARRQPNGGVAEIVDVEAFDLMQIHNLVNWEGHLDTLAADKAAGRIRISKSRRRMAASSAKWNG